MEHPSFISSLSSFPAEYVSLLVYLYVAIQLLRRAKTLINRLTVNVKLIKRELAAVDHAARTLIGELTHWDSAPSHQTPHERRLSHRRLQLAVLSHRDIPEKKRMLHRLASVRERWHRLDSRPS